MRIFCSIGKRSKNLNDKVLCTILFLGIVTVNESDHPVSSQRLFSVSNSHAFTLTRYCPELLHTFFASAI